MPDQKYRLYIDEVGNSDLGSSKDPNHRYLSLTGLPPEVIHVHLTSRQLKVKSKANNIAGLQLADLIAHPSYKIALARRNSEAIPQNFGGQIGAILLKQKYDRGPLNKIDGWGIEWLP